MEALRRKYRILLKTIPLEFQRSLMGRINWKTRAICIEGARGTGKSTLMLQYIRKNNDLDRSLYVSLDDLYFREHSFSQVAEEFYRQGGRHLFVDEVHKYSNWQQEVKNIYDFFPELQMVISGSSILALQRSQADLSRRLIWYQLNELSVREYISLETGLELPAYNLDDILTEPNTIVEEISQFVPSPVKIFHDYWSIGAYPFFKEGKEEFLIRVNQLINVIIDYDLPESGNFGIATLAKLKRLLYILSTSVPFKPNIAKLARMVETSRIRLLEMLHILEEAHLIRNLRSDVHGVSMLNKPDKIFLRNTSLIMSLANGNPEKGNLRETFFYSQLSNAGHIVTNPRSGDFMIDNRYLFEIGGKGKSLHQIAGESNAFVGADDIEFASPKKIPLWLFGFLY